MDKNIEMIDPNARIDTIVAPDHLVDAYKHLGINVIPMSEWRAEHGD